jgi:hypothetical protein
MARCFFAFVIALSLAGCAQQVSKLPPPSGRLMAPPEKFPKVADKDDARAKLIEAALVHQRNSARQRDLQEWAKAASDN